MQHDSNDRTSPSHKDIPTPLRLIMLMIQCTPRTPPRLTSLPLPLLPNFNLRTLSRTLTRIVLLGPPIIPPRHRNTALDTLRTETQTAIIARHSTETRLQYTATVIAAPCTVPGLGAPHAQSVPDHGLAARPLEQYA